MFKPKKMILTAGPSISKKELKYLTDVAVNGWNWHWSDYIHKFEKKFAQHVGVKYAIATDGGTGALHLALAAFGIKAGDEVIVPEITWYACSDVVKYFGAKPVFVDILKDTWCIDPEKIEKAITKKTKAIMPVYAYGNLADMDEIMAIANKHHLYVIEDACPAGGSIYKGKKPGSIGHAGAYSFQGAKIMVTGYGGMFVTRDKKIYERAFFLNHRGEDPKKKFWQLETGYSHEMSNILAAFGLAQLERLPEFVEKKRKIFSWYKSRLGKITGISMNFERPRTKANCWMSSIVLDKNFGIKRDEVIKKLREHNIDSRPFFYPISMFPMYEEQNTPIAHHVGLNGINLPSGVMLKKKEIDYVCDSLIQILGVKA